MADDAHAHEPTEREPTASPDDVPDSVLEELLAAFSDERAEEIDFDDPEIDRLLGLGDAADGTDDIVGLDDDQTDQRARGELGEAGQAEETVALNVHSEAPNRKLIVIGADDDRPDALYLDEESGSRLREVHTSGDEESGGRSTIVIQDLDESGSIEALPARSSGSIDPRVRARRIAVRRAKGRKRLIWLAIAAAILLVLVGAVAVLASSLFDVRTVDVQGAVYTNPEELTAIVDDINGDAILLVDTRAIEQRLERIPWVESARVTTDFPHRVFIDIRERKPIATFAGSDGKYRVIDRDGRVLDVLEGGIPIHYMLVTGANPDVDQGQFAGRPFAAAAQLTIALPPEIRALTESVTIDATVGNLALELRGGVHVQLGAASDLSTKLARLLSQVRGGLDGVSALDVSTSEISRTTTG